MNMTNGMKALPGVAAALSLILMGAFGVQLFLRLIRLLRGAECADGFDGVQSGAPVREIFAAAAAALVSRLMLYIIAHGIYRMFGGEIPSLLHAMPRLWTHWDVRHYLGIAQQGYTAVGDDRFRLVFFPLYPFLIRLVMPMFGGNAFFAGTGISLACASGAAGILYDLSYLHGGRKTAVRSTAYFLLNPLSVFLACAYTEALFLLLTLGCVHLLRRGKPWRAAFCGMLSALTRMPGVIVAGLFLIALLERIGKRTLTLRAVLNCAGQMLLVFCGLLIYWGINRVVTGDPMMYLTYQKENWYQEAGTFWHSAGNTMTYFLHTVGEYDWLSTWGCQLLAMFGVFVLLALRQSVLPFDLAAYSFVYVWVVLSPTWLLSGARYLYALCALPLLLAKAHGHRIVHLCTLGAMGVLLVFFTYGYTIASLVF